MTLDFHKPSRRLAGSAVAPITAPKATETTTRSGSHWILPAISKAAIPVVHRGNATADDCATDPASTAILSAAATTRPTPVRKMAATSDKTVSAIAGPSRARSFLELDELPGMRDLLGRQSREGSSRTPRAFAAIRPLLMRSAIKDRSKSAMPANTINTMRPAGVLVSAHGSASERTPSASLLDPLRNIENVAGRSGDAV